MKPEFFEHEIINFDYLERQTGISKIALIEPFKNILERKLISLAKGKINGGYIAAYKKRRKQYEEKFELKIMSASHVVGDYRKTKEYLDYFTDKYCDLGKELFDKLNGKNNTSLKIDSEMIEKLRNIEVSPMDYCTFELVMHKDKLKKYFNEYLDNFISDKFNTGDRYSYAKQFNDIAITIQKLINAGYSREALILNPAHIFPRNKTDIRPTDRKQILAIALYHFFTVILAMEKQGFLNITDIMCQKKTFAYPSNGADFAWEAMTMIKVKISLTDKFDELFSKKSNIKEVENKKPDKKTAYNYTDYSGIGILNMGNSPITFKKLRAKIIDFFFKSKELGNEHKNYKDFNEFSGENGEQTSSDEFNKEIKAINNRLKKETKGLVKELIIKKENKKNEANIYSWNDKIN